VWMSVCENKALVVVLLLVSLYGCSKPVSKGTIIGDEFRSRGETNEMKAKQLDSGSFFPDVPAAIRSPLLTAPLPSRFDSYRDLMNWAGALPIRARISGLKWAESELDAIAISAFSGRRAIVLVVFASRNQDRRLIYLNSGVDLTRTLQDPFTVQLDARDRLQLLSGGEMAGYVEFRQGREAIELAFKR